MRVGISLRSAYAPPDVRTGARWMVEQAAAAEAAGLDSLFVGDHHATGGPYYQNSPMLGRLLAEWGRRPAGALYLLPLWNPVLVAEQVGTLAALAPGRFVLQCALGADERQFAAMGADIRRRAAVFERSLAVVRRLLAGEAVDGVTIGPLPAEPVEVWIGGTAPKAVDRAARLGDAWLAGPELVPARAAELVGLYRDRCAVHGRAPAAVAIRRDVHVGADDDDAERVARPVLDRGYRGFDPSAPVVGGVHAVAEQFRSLARLGYTDVIVRPLADDQADTLACIKRMAAVRQALAG
ncbi:MAG TPA: LLM class flavin-dependent oxidoreductase [Acidimicrobiales bacterium]|nr:LLM class flavin-dependent oxidoreductase [Acidimicrobiales bacterium]